MREANPGRIRSPEIRKCPKTWHFQDIQLEIAAKLFWFCVGLVLSFEAFWAS